MNEEIKLAEAKKIIAQIERWPLNPANWQALGKALEWPEKLGQTTYGSYNTGTGQGEEITFGGEPAWLYRAKEYFDLVLTGDDTEAFWKDLLKQSETLQHQRTDQ